MIKGTESAAAVLRFITRKLLMYLEELAGCDDSDEEFVYGEKTAYVECLEWIQNWEEAAENGLNFEIEERYPL